MILGIGNDLCFVERIRRSLSRFGDAYIEHLFSPEERQICEATSDPARYFARGFCGKEAYSKALGTGMTSGVGWRDIEVLQTNPKATLRLSDGALDHLRDLMPIGFAPTFHIACSDDHRVAQAVVIISAVPSI